MMDDVKVKEAGNKARGKGKGKGKADSSAPSPKGPETQIARMMVRALWQQEWAAANPNKTAADKGAAWKEIRTARLEAELKKLRRALLSVKKSGVTMTVSEKAAKVADSDEEVPDAAEE